MEFEKSGKLVSFSTKVREISMFFHLKVREISIFWLKSQGSLILKFCGNPVILLVAEQVTKTSTVLKLIGGGGDEAIFLRSFQF